MRKTVLATTVALLTLLGLTGVAFAADLPSHRNPGGSPPGGERGKLGLQTRSHFVPLGVKLAGYATVNGHTYDYYGSPASGAYVYWEAPYLDTWEWGETSTDASGAYGFSDLPAASGTGYVYAGYPEYGMWRDGASWADYATTTFDWRPGAVSTAIARGGVWTGWDYVSTYLYGADALSNVAGGSDIYGTNDVAYGNSYAPAGTYSIGATYFWMDQGLEFPMSAVVDGGAVSGQSISVDQAAAQRISVTGPYWASGKPGTVAKVRHWNYPGSWRLDYYGYAQSPSGKPYKDYADMTTTGADPFTKSLTIPKTAPAGYSYVLGAYNKSGVLELETPLQVCTLTATKTRIAKGAAIRVSGKVPVQDHWGSQAGQRTRVNLWAHWRTKGVPTKWDPRGQGWFFVGSVATDAYGKYVTPRFKPPRTLTLVVQYPGDDWYWGAYTSTRKISVY